MKAKFLRTVSLVAVASALGWAVSQEARNPEDAQKPVAEAPGTNLPPAAETKTIAAPAGAPAVPAPVPKSQPAPTPAPQPETAAPVVTNAPAANVRVVQSFAPPANMKLSPGLEEIIQLVQAGVSEDVLLAYITSSTNIFNVGSTEVVYLNDLGVSAAVLTTLIQHDASPETMARKQAAAAVQPLPPGIALKTPATNIYPATAAPPTETADWPGNSSFYTEPVVAPPPEPEPVTTTETINAAPQVTTVSYFYDSLAPYGNWVSVPEYGLCWQPTVAVADYSWRPYSSNGRWIWSDAGWYWYSGYSWGWAPFHYGRWSTYPNYGWLWIPDTSWGPSWVTWRYTPYHCGWAPLPPSCHYVNGFGLYFGGGSVGVGFGFGYGYDAYTFVPANRFCEPNLHHYYVPREHARTVYKDSVVVNNYIVGNNNTIVNKGIGLERVEKATRGEIPRATIRDVAFSKAHNVRLERLEHHENGLAVGRPTLPKDPPMNPAVVAARAKAANAPDRAVGAPPARPTRVRPNETGLRPDASLAATPKSDGGPATGPAAPSTRATPPLRSPRDSTVNPRPARPNPAGLTAKNPSEPVATASTSPQAAAPERPQSSAPPPTTVTPSRVRPERPSTSGTPSSPTTVTRTPTTRATPPVPAGSGTPSTSARPSRPDTRVNTAPSTVSRPSSPSVPSSRSYIARSDSPRVVAPSAPTTVAPPRYTPSAPVRIERVTPAPSPSYSPPAVSAPASRSAPAPSYSPPPARSAPAPAPAPAPSSGGGGSSGGGSRPSRPGR